MIRHIFLSSVSLIMEDIYVYKSALTKVYTKLNFSFYLSFQDWYELPLPFVFLVGTSKGLNT